MKILCVGDSNTYGYDPRSYIGSRYPSEVRWTDRLRSGEVINFGMNGMTVPRDDSGYIDLIRKQERDLTVVMLGTNDLLEGGKAEHVAARMDGFIASIIEPGAQLLLIAPPVLKHGEWVQSESLIEESMKLASLYREVADRRHCSFADAGEWDIEVTFDGVHFSPEGHAGFARNLEEVLAVKLQGE